MEVKDFPLIEYVLSFFPDNMLDNSILIGCQHLLPSVQLLLNALFKKGLPSQNVALIGKCYSSSIDTIKTLQGNGVFIDPLSLSFDSHKSYKSEFYSFIKRFLTSRIKNKNFSNYENVIILDDGGDLHLLTNKLLHDFTNLIGVEQTSRGIQQLRKIDLPYPIVNVARSKIKLIYESPMVAEAVVKELKNHLLQTNINPNHILVIGKGSIGQAVTKQLKKDLYQVTAFDFLASKSDVSRSGLKKLANHIDLIIGCTGTNILPLIKKYGLLKKGLVLASASSSDLEFDAPYFRLQCTKTNDCHTNINADGIHLLNCGFPINFYGGNKDQVSLTKFQLTTALLLAGVLQELPSKNKNKLIDLDDNLQACIIKKFTEGSQSENAEYNKVSNNIEPLTNEVRTFI